MSRDMRSAAANIVLAVGTALALAVGIGFAFFYRDSAHNASMAPHIESAPAPAAATAPAPGAADHGAVFVPLPARPPAAAPVEPKPEGDQPTTPPTIPPAGVTPDAGHSDAPSDLHNVELQPHEVHPVPDTDEPAKPVTLMTQDGKIIGIEHPRAGPPSSYVPSVGPGSGPSTKFSHSGRPSAANKATNVAAAPGLAGSAIVTDVDELNVEGHPLRLYGVKAPEAWDVCAPDPHYAARACPEVSRDVLTSRLKGKGVTCRLMAPAAAAALPAICDDGTGTDLGAYLVSQGFALADARESGNYANAENAARSARLGLWRYR